MLICPNCRVIEINTDPFQCSHCAWQLERSDHIPILLANDNENCYSFSAYRENYTTLAQYDLEHSILDKSYVKIQNRKMFSYAPSLSHKHVCEVGIGKGYLIKDILTEHPKRLVGIDIALDYLKKLNKEVASFKQVSLVQANAENIPYINEFDVLFASDILEHVINPGNFVFCVNQALKMNGKFIVRVPFNENILAYSKYQGCDYTYAHLRNFNKDSLTAILANSGFEIEQFHYDGYLSYKKKPYLEKYNLAKKFYEFLIKRYGGTDNIPAIQNWLAKLFINPLELVCVCKKIKTLSLITSAPKITHFEIKQPRCFLLNWEYDFPDQAHEFHICVFNEAGALIKTESTKAISEHIIQLPECIDTYQISIYAVNNGELKSAHSKRIKFTISNPTEIF